MIGNYVIAFDIAAIIIVVSLLVTMHLRKLNKGRAGIILYVFMFIAILTSVLDIMSISSMIGRKFMFAINSLYFIFRIVTAFMCLLYMVTITDLLGKFLKNKAIVLITLAPSAIFIIFLAIINPITGAVFDITADGEYVRGPLLWINYVVAGFYLFAGMYCTIKYSKLFTVKKRFALWMVPFLTVLALLIQFYNPYYLIETFATSIIVIFFILLLDEPDKYSDTGIGNYKGFLKDMRISLFSKDERTIVISLLENYASLKNLISYEDMYGMIKELSLKVLGSQEKTMRYANSYYIGKGIFATCLDFSSRNKEMDFINKMDNSLVSFHIKNHFSIPLSLKNIIIKTPSEIGEPEELEKFIDYIVNNDLPKGSIIKYSNLICDSDFILETNIDSIVRRAMRNGNITVYYQPIIDLKANRITSAEALVRLIDPEYGFVSPGIFIPYIEKTGDINRVTYIVLEKTCEFIASDAFKELGIEYIEVNVSPNQLIDPYIADTFMDILNRYNVPTKRINLEITESQKLGDSETVLNNIRRFVELGFSLSLDDYGTGYSNLKRFVMSPLSIVKIDKTMVDGYKETNMRILLEDTIRLIHRLKMKIVCEGVEDIETLNFFKEKGVDYVQGFYYSKALPLEEFTEFVKKW